MIIPDPLPAVWPTAVRYILPWALILVLTRLSQQANTRPVRLVVGALTLASARCWLGGVQFKDPFWYWFNHLLSLGLAAILLVVPRLCLLSDPYLPSRKMDHPVLCFLFHPLGQDFQPIPPFFQPARPKPTRSGKPFTNREHLFRSLRGFALMALILGYVRSYVPTLWTTDESVRFSIFEKLSRPSPLLPAGTPAWVEGWLGGIALGGFVICFLDAGYHTYAFMRGAQGEPGWGRITRSAWAATSIHSFWTTHWHPLLSTFTQFYTALLIPSRLPSSIKNVARSLIAFAITALTHDPSILPSATVNPHPSILGGGVTKFMLLQSLGLGLEYMFRAITGKRVGGFLGWIWAMGFLGWTARWAVQGFVDYGLVRGMALLGQKWSGYLS